MDALALDPTNREFEIEPPTDEEVERAKMDDWVDAIAEFRLREIRDWTNER